MQPLAEEAGNLFPVRRLVSAASRTAGQGQRQIRLGKNLDDCVGRPAQRERILGAGGRHADRKHRDDGLHAIGDAQQLSFHRHRNIVVRRSGRVLLVDRQRYPLAEPLRARIEAANNALQLSEFLHQLGSEVGLREFDSLAVALPHRRPPSPPLRSQPAAPQSR